MTRAATELCEAFTGRLLIAREVEEVLPATRRWARLGVRPVRSIGAVSALAADGTASALPSHAYAIDVDAAGDGWVRLTAPSDAKRVRVGYVAGLADDGNAVPEALRQGIVRLAAHMYARGDESGMPPAAITALWRPWRRLRLGEGAAPCSSC